MSLCIYHVQSFERDRLVKSIQLVFSEVTCSYLLNIVDQKLFLILIGLN